MTIFETGRKTNFCDTNDVLVGFDNGQCCCESFGHYLSLETFGEELDIDVEDFVFDKTFFDQQDDNDGGGEACFKLVRSVRLENDRVMRTKARERVKYGLIDTVYLNLFNHHNGYYSHGFELSVGGEVIETGYL